MMESQLILRPQSDEAQIHILSSSSSSAWYHVDNEVKHSIFLEKLGKWYVLYAIYLVLSSGATLALEYFLLKDGPSQMQYHSSAENILLILLFCGMTVGTYGFLTMILGFCESDTPKVQRALLSFQVMFGLVALGLGGIIILTSISQGHFRTGLALISFLILLLLWLNISAGKYILTILKQIENNLPEELRLQRERMRALTQADVGRNI